MNVERALKEMSKEEIVEKIAGRRELFCKTCGNIKVKNGKGVDFCDKCGKFVCFRCGAHLKEDGECTGCHIIIAEESLVPVAQLRLAVCL